MTTTAPTGAPTVASAKTISGYVVLKEQTKPSMNTASSAPTGGWEIVGTYQAASAAAAIRKYAGKDTADLSVLLVAVPVKSWKPVKVTAKTTVALIVEDAK